MWSAEHKFLSSAHPPALFLTPANITCSFSICACFINLNILLLSRSVSLSFPFSICKRKIGLCFNQLMRWWDRGLLAGRLRKVNIWVWERERESAHKDSHICVNPLLAGTDEWNSGCEIKNKISHLPGICRVLGTPLILVRKSSFSIKMECSCQSWKLKHFVNYQKTGGIWREENTLTDYLDSWIQPPSVWVLWQIHF